jgi:hypothetical protein
MRRSDSDKIRNTVQIELVHYETSRTTSKFPMALLEAINLSRSYSTTVAATIQGAVSGLEFNCPSNRGTPSLMVELEWEKGDS